MDVWIWLFIGFLTGIVVAAIVGLLFRGDSSKEEEKTESQAETQLAKSEVKITVLEDKLRLAEADQLALKEKLEAEHQEQLESAQAEHRAELAIIESEKMALAASLAEAQKRLKQYDEQKEPTAEELDDSVEDDVQIDEEKSQADPQPVVEDVQEGAGEATPDMSEQAVVITEETEDETEPQIVEQIYDPHEFEEIDVVETMDQPDEEDLSAAEGIALASAVATDDNDQDVELLEEKEVIEDVDNSPVTVEDEFDKFQPLEDPEIVPDQDSIKSWEETSAESENDKEDGTLIEDDSDQLEEITPALGASAAALLPEDSPEEELDTAEPVEEVDSVFAEMKVNTEEESDIEVVNELETDLDPSFDEEPVIDAPESMVWPEDDSVWRGEYFNNMNLEGEPDLVREDEAIDFDWEFGSPAPEIDIDNFSVRWTRKANLPPGLYRFTVTSDDGARLWVNERLIISAWYDHKQMTFRREMELSGGPVNLRLEYYEKDMEALIRCFWERIG